MKQAANKACGLQNWDFNEEEATCRVLEETTAFICAGV
jgi:hypothetical protein